jgi:hypothetical protein
MLNNESKDKTWITTAKMEFMRWTAEYVQTVSKLRYIKTIKNITHIEQNFETQNQVQSKHLENSKK